MSESVAGRIARPQLTGHHAPFWFWNGPLDPVEMRRQVALMAEQGVTGAMPHPRFGMDRRDYLEAPYWAAMDATVDEAVRLGSKVYLYDEYNWPSGAAGGRVLEGHPEFLPRALDYAVRDVTGGGTVTLDGFTAGQPFSGRFERILAAFLVPGDCPILSLQAGAELPCREREETPVRWGAVAPDGHSISGTVPAGQRRVLVFFQTMCSYPTRLNVGSDAFLGYLQPGATERFIELTYDAYAKRYQRHFGSVIPAIFTDEPSTISPGPFPWSDDFAAEFRARRGYDLVEHLPALCDDRHPDGWRVRADYWRLVGELFNERFYEPVGSWCREHGIAFTGHCFEEDAAAWGAQPQLMNALRQFDWPGVDALGPRARAAACKIPASVAHLESKAHFLCEALGLAGGWNATLTMLRRGYQYLGVMGVDVFVPHAFHQTVENPRVECPPSFFYQNPYWPYYRAVAGLTDRLSAFNQSGVHVAPVAVYYPIESLWADGTGGRGQGGYPWQLKSRGNHRAMRAADVFNAALTVLSAGPFDCDVVDTEALAKAALDGATGELCIGAERFSCLVLPAVRTIGAAAVPVIEAFVRAGGTLVLLGDAPGRAYPETDAAGAFARLIASPGGGHVVCCPDTTDEAVLAARLLPALAERLVPTVHFPEGKPAGVYVMARRTGSSLQWLFVNDEASACACTVVLPGARMPRSLAGQAVAVRRVDVATGRVETCAVREVDGGLSVRIELGGTDAAVYTAEAAGNATACPVRPAVPTAARHLADWTFQLVPMDSMDVNTTSAWIDLPVWKWQARSAATSPEWMRPNHDDSGWTSVAAVRGEALQPAQVALFRGLLPPGARAIRQPVPASGEYVVYVDGVCVEERLGPAAEGGVLALPLRAGAEAAHIAMEVCSESTLSGLTGPVAVDSGPVRLPRLDSWRDMGLWWYVGRAVYRTEVMFGTVPERVVLDLGTVEHYAEVWVNGRRAGECLWAPYCLDIADFLQAGANEIRILVSNSVANRFLWDRWSDARTGASWGVPPKAEASGLLGPVYLKT